MERGPVAGRRALVFVRSSPRSLPAQLFVKGVFVVYALLLLVRIEYGLLRHPLADTCRGLGLRLHDPAAPRRAGAMPWGDVHRSAARAWRVLRGWPFDDTCLRRCLLLGAVIRDHHPELVIGVRRDDLGALQAHSWIMLAGESIDPTSPQFSAFALE